MENKIKKDSIVSFIRNHDPREAHFEGGERIFSIPYSKIIEAAQFCERERLDKVFLGFKNKAWRIEVISDAFELYITIDNKGISPETEFKYVYSVTRQPFS